MKFLAFQRFWKLVRSYLQSFSFYFYLFHLLLLTIMHRLLDVGKSEGSKPMAKKEFLRHYVWFVVPLHLTVTSLLNCTAHTSPSWQFSLFLFVCYFTNVCLPHRIASSKMAETISFILLYSQNLIKFSISVQYILAEWFE